MKPTTYYHPVSRTTLCRRHAPTALGLLALALAGGHAAQAQTPAVTLSLLTPNGTNVYTTAVGATVTLTVDLTGGTNLSGYNANVLVNPTQLQFVNTAASGAAVYYTSTNNSFFYLGSQINASGSDLNFTTSNFAAASNTGINALGTFQVKVLSALTPGALTFGPIGAAQGFNGTNVSDSTSPTPNNELTATTGATLATPAATPEPSQTAAFGLGVLGLAGLTLRARRAKQAC